jgi:hypothetical protein
MLKQKYLHRSRRKKGRDEWHYGYKRGKNLDILNDDLPFHDNMKKKGNYHYICTEPVAKFIESKVGCDWNDVYSELLSKTKKKFRYEVENTIKYTILMPTYDENYLPVLCNRSYYYRGYGVKIFVDRLFIGLDNKICKMSEDEIKREANVYVRRDKLRQIIENMKKEQDEENAKNQDLSS